MPQFGFGAADSCCTVTAAFGSAGYFKEVLPSSGGGSKLTPKMLDKPAAGLLEL